MSASRWLMRAAPVLVLCAMGCATDSFSVWWTDLGHKQECVPGSLESVTSAAQATLREMGFSVETKDEGTFTDLTGTTSWGRRINVYLFIPARKCVSPPPEVCVELENLLGEPYWSQLLKGIRSKMATETEAKEEMK
jgi:hypothetical protein